MNQKYLLTDPFYEMSPYPPVFSVAVKKYDEQGNL